MNLVLSIPPSFCPVCLVVFVELAHYFLHGIWNPSWVAFKPEIFGKMYVGQE